MLVIVKFHIMIIRHYRKVSIHDIVFSKLSYHIEFLVIHFEDYRIVSNFDNLIWSLSYRIKFWYFLFEIIVLYQIW